MSSEQTIKNMHLVIKAISNKKMRLEDEKRLQSEIAEALKEGKVEFKKEFILDQESIIDFMVGKLGVEVKIKSNESSMQIYRQIERYTQSDQIDGILLLTSRAISLPEQINGKSVTVFSLNRLS